MSTTNNTMAPSEVQELVITRLFDAPRELVFKVFTEPEHLVHWWGPKGTKINHCEVDLRPGGTFHYCILGPDGGELWGKLTYREIEAPERLLFITSFSDAEGNTVRNPFSADWPLEVLSENTFTESDGKTLLTIRVIPHNPTDAEVQAYTAGRDGMNAGTNGMLDVLEEYLDSLQD